MRYRIVCSTQELAWKDYEHAAIDEIGTGTELNEWSERWTVEELVEAIDATPSTRREREQARELRSSTSAE